jgi:hypothetical protein
LSGGSVTARIESQAVGGYYALPADLIPLIAALVDTASVNVPRGRVAVVDPCAADGAALLGLLRCWFGENLRGHHSDKGPQILAYTAELERERIAALKRGCVGSMGKKCVKVVQRGCREESSCAFSLINFRLRFHQA